MTKFIGSIRHYVSEKLWLSLEDYYNNGLSSEEAKVIIESLSIPSNFNKFYCEPSGLNGNWVVSLPFNVNASDAMDYIEIALQQALREKNPEVRFMMDNYKSDRDYDSEGDIFNP